MPSPRIPDELSNGPFTRQQALVAGLTSHQLRSSAWRQLFRRVWVRADFPDSRELRLAAAKLVLPPTGVLCGLTAAWVHGADVRRLGDLDVHVGFPEGKRIRSQEGLSVCQETLAASDICRIDDVPVTTAVRTVFDCLRLLRGAERLVVADAMTHAELVSIHELRVYFAGKRRLRNLRIAERLLDWVEPLTESAMETRLRVLALEAGLPQPVAQLEVFDRWQRFVARLDLAYPELMVAVEFDGALHWEQRRQDDRRRDALRALGWIVLVFSADDIYRTPDRTVSQIAQALRSRATPDRTVSQIAQALRSRAA